jgi:IS5 family transposase
VVSLHDPDARPIRKGRLGKPVEFGYKAQIVDNVDGLIVDHLIVKGNPADGPMLAPAIGRVKARFGRAPGAVTADRGYAETKVDADLVELGVKTVAVPRKGRPGAARQEVQAGTGVREAGQVANRLRGSHLDGETGLGAGPHVDGRRDRSANLVRVGCPGPQLGQGRPTHRHQKLTGRRRPGHRTVPPGRRQPPTDQLPNRKAA